MAGGSEVKESLFVIGDRAKSKVVIYPFEVNNEELVEDSEIWS